MDYFSVFGESFQNCLDNLDLVLTWCEENNFVLNWEKCHFIVKEGIVLGHKILKRGLEVDQAKIEVIEKLPPPVNIKGIRASWGMAYIEDSSNISQKSPNSFANCCK